MTPTWQWNRARGRYEVTLEDGSELRAIFHRRGRSGPHKAGREKAGFWSANVRPVWDQRQHDLGCYGDPFPDADTAKRAAIDWYTRKQPAPGAKAEQRGKSA